jgi:hypothetical protein
VINYKLLLISILFLTSCIQHVEPGYEEKISKNWLPKDAAFPEEDEFYTLFYKYDLHLALTNVRPSQSDTAIQFCIPAAFTVLENDSIDGVFIVDGKIINRKVNHHLGGGMIIAQNKNFILKTDDGKLLTETWIDSIAKLGQSFFQQIQLVRDGKALEFNKDQKLFQRRAIVTWENGEITAVESKNSITLQEFADDLVKMHVTNAIYTDMGSFDEGWYRNPVTSGIVTIGKNKSETARQSNWLIFRF